MGADGEGSELGELPVAAREDAEALVRTAFRHGNDAVFVIDLEADEIREVNRRALALLGYDRAELVGAPPEKVHPDEVTAFRSFVASVRREGGGFTDELTCLTADGRTLPAEISASTVDLGGREHLIAFVRETAERDRQREGIAALERASRRLQRAESVGEIADITVSISEEVLDHGLTGLWVYDGERLVPEAFTEGAKALAADLEADAPTFGPGSFEMEVFERGEPTLVEDHAELETTASGESGLGTVFMVPLGEHGVLHIGDREVREIDDTERDMIEILAGHATAALDRASRERELAARNEELVLLNRIVRHDIRNDMTVSAGWLERIRDEVDPSVRERLDTVIEAVEHTVEVTRIVGDVIETMDEGGGFDLSAVDLVAAVESEVERCREVHAGASLSFAHEADRVPVRANAMVSSIVRNLINNAIQHNDKDVPRVEVAVETEGGEAVLRIADNGPGIDDDRKEALFDREGLDPDTDGLGLGLYLVATLVDAYGGGIDVTDNDPEGTVFEVRFERADAG